MIFFVAFSNVNKILKQTKYACFVCLFVFVFKQYREGKLSFSCTFSLFTGYTFTLIHPYSCRLTHSHVHSHRLFHALSHFHWLTHTSVFTYAVSHIHSYVHTLIHSAICTSTESLTQMNVHTFHQTFTGSLKERCSHICSLIHTSTHPLTHRHDTMRGHWA